ncbi:MAG: inactive transglutaminase family protein [Alcanivoracaceae bacterium]|nr:inactive transglutaminase family protein [Alcanivoracaceae bacterium]
MRSVRLHATLLALVLLALGLTSVFWQVFVRDIPLLESETDPVWIIDTRLEFDSKKNNPVKVQMFVPPNGDFVTLNESFVSNNYGVNVHKSGENRQVTWSTRRADGHQVLYYRLVLTRRFSIADQAAPPGPQFRQSAPLLGAEGLAAEALLAPIRDQSADIETFISETIRRVNDIKDDNVRVLLRGDYSVASRAGVVDLLLAAAHIPAEQVHTVRLGLQQSQEPELWLRSYNGKNWLYFNPADGVQGLPEDRLVWWSGDKPLVKIDGGRHLQVGFSVSKNEMSAIQLAQSVQPLQDRSFWTLSLYDLPLEAQHTFRIIVMIPLGVLLILLLRNLIGLETLGTFTPVLVALAFRETDLIWGIILFTVITALGLSLRSYLEQLRLQMLPRLSVVLTFVVILITVISVLTHKLGLERGVSVALFPMVILTMVIERLSIVWEERGGGHSMKVAFGTLVAATLAHLIMSPSELIYIFFTFPGILLVLVSIMLLMGHYRGYRLMELIRFKAMTKETPEK